MDETWKKWTFRFVILSLLFVAVSFVRYYPIDMANEGVSLTPLSNPMGTDSIFYIGGIETLTQATNSTVTMGHIGTLVMSQIVTFLTPNSITGVALLGFYSLFFAWSAYLFLREKTDRAWLIFILAPFSLYIHRMATGGVYAQLFAVSLFFLSLWTWETGKEKITGMMLLATISAHVWSGVILLLIFLTYVLFLNREKVKENWIGLTPLLSLPIAGVLWSGALERFWNFFFFFNENPESFFYPYHVNSTNWFNWGVFSLVLCSVLGRVIGGKKWIEQRLNKVMLAWFGVSTVIIAVFFGSEMRRIVTMLPFLILGVDGLSYLMDKKYWIIIAVIGGLTLLSGYTGM